jgi:hypothetical protein
MAYAFHRGKEFQSGAARKFDSILICTSYWHIIVWRGHALGDLLGLLRTWLEMDMFRVTSIAAMCCLSLGALADDASPGLWQESGYIEDETGKRTSCFGGELCFNMGLPINPNQGKLCASGQDLRVYARQHLADIATLSRGRLHNCKDAGDGSVNCDEGSMTQTFSSPDATHVEFSNTTRVSGHRMTRLWFYERLGDDCSAANELLRKSH